MFNSKYLFLFINFLCIVLFKNFNTADLFISIHFVNFPVYRSYASFLYEEKSIEFKSFLHEL